MPERFMHTVWLVTLALTISLAGSASAASEAEMKREMKTLVDNHFSQCGTDLFTKIFYGYMQIFQLKDAQVEVVNLPLNEMDKLNGVQWQAEVTAKPKAVRVYPSSDTQKKWSDWREPTELARHRYVLIAVSQQPNKRRGDFGPGLRQMAGGAMGNFSPVPCNQIPPG